MKREEKLGGLLGGYARRPEIPMAWTDVSINNSKKKERERFNIKDTSEEKYNLTSRLNLMVLEEKKLSKRQIRVYKFFTSTVVITLKRVKIPLHFLQELSPPPLCSWPCLHSLSALYRAGYFTVSGTCQPFPGSAFIISSTKNPYPFLSGWQTPPLLEGPPQIWPSFRVQFIASLCVLHFIHIFSVIFCIALQ